MYNEMIHILLLLTSKIADTHTHTHKYRKRSTGSLSWRKKWAAPQFVRIGRLSGKGAGWTAPVISLRMCGSEVNCQERIHLGISVCTCSRHRSAIVGVPVFLINFNFCCLRQWYIFLAIQRVASPWENTNQTEVLVSYLPALRAWREKTKRISLGADTKMVWKGGNGSSWSRGDRRAAYRSSCEGEKEMGQGGSRTILGRWTGARRPITVCMCVYKYLYLVL